MSELRYLGPKNNKTPLTNTELNDKDIETVTQSQITSAIDDALADKASGPYLDNSVSGKLQKSELQSYGVGKMAKSTVNQPRGPVGVANDRVPNIYAPSIPGGRTWRNFGNTPNWSIGDLGQTTIDSNPRILTTWTLPDIGYSYLPIFLGSCELGDPAGAELQIRLNSSTGPMYARAASPNTAIYDGCQIMPAGNIQAIRSGTFYIVVGRKFSGASGSAIGSQYNLSCFGVPS